MPIAASFGNIKNLNQKSKAHWLYANSRLLPTNKKMGKSVKEENQYPALFGLLKRRLSEDGEWTLEVEWKRVFAVLAVLVALLWRAGWVLFSHSLNTRAASKK